MDSTGQFQGWKLNSLLTCNKVEDYTYFACPALDIQIRENNSRLMQVTSLCIKDEFSSSLGNWELLSIKLKVLLMVYPPIKPGENTSLTVYWRKNYRHVSQG